MINSVHIQNFKNIRNQKIAFERFTVFAGANGSGKTNVLDAVHMAVRAAAGDPSKVFVNERHCDWLHTHGAYEDLSVTVTTPGGTFAVKATPPPGPPPLSNQWGTRTWSFQVIPESGRQLDDALEHARPIVFSRLDAHELAKPSYREYAPPRVEVNGNGLASVLADMAHHDPDGFDTIMVNIKKFICNLKRIRFDKEAETELITIGDDPPERVKNRRFPGEALLFDFDNANNVAAHAVSEGALSLLGILTILLGPTQPKILLTDHLEHGLHPLAQSSLIDALKRIMDEFGDLQIIAGTHSPWLLDQLRHEQIRLMTLNENGYAVCGQLTDHPKFELWKEEMAPGELWSLFGEKWLVDGGVSA